jgi:hypothetical protein
MSDLEKIESEIATFHYEGDILFIIFKPDIEITLEKAKAYIDVRKSVQKEKKVKLVSDVSKVWSVTKEARAYFATEEVTNMILAMALITNSLQAKVYANFFMKEQPENPTKAFTSIENAIDWLDSF